MANDDIRIPQSYSNFRILYIVTQFLGLAIIIMMGSWIGVYLGGLGWYSSTKLQFNWHPLLMTIGMIYLQANAILSYRAFRHARKKDLKLTHALIHLTTIFLIVIALIAVFDSHNLAEKPIPNLYSLHSWVGLIAVILFCIQWLFGFITFLVPGMRDRIKEFVMPIHIYFGIVAYLLSAAAMLLGLLEKASFSMGDTIVTLPNQGVLVNLIGILLLIFSGLVVYLVTERNYKRLPLPEDQMLLTQNAE